MADVNLSEVRRKSWETRRARYGHSGHAGAYLRPPTLLGRRALQLIAKLHAEAVLSEGQCCKALKMDRVQFRIMCDEFAEVAL